MKRFLLLIFMAINYLIAGQTQNDLLFEMLSELIDTDAGGMQYLVDCFPYGEIDFAHLREEDLDRLFFLSPQSREILWSNRIKAGKGDGFDNLDILPVERQLLLLCKKEKSLQMSGRFYSRFSILEEVPKGETELIWPGPRYAHWQKFQLKIRHFSMGLSFQKDPGEKNFSDAGNGYFSYQKEGLVTGAGTFFPSFGLGLIYSPPRFNSYKMLLSSPLQHRIRGYNGSEENWGLNGVYGQIEIGNSVFFCGYGRQNFDARKNEQLYTINISGYHRNETEIAAQNIVGIDNYYFSFLYNNSFYKVGSLLSIQKYTHPVKYQNHLWNGRKYYHSIFFSVPVFDLRGEIKTYPGFSTNISGSLLNQKNRIDVYTYYYDLHPPINSRHFLYNRLAAGSWGINLRWSEKKKIRDRFHLSGYINIENRYQDHKKYLISGFSFHWQKLFEHSLGLHISKTATELDNETKWYITYILKQKLINSGSFSARLQYGSEGVYGKKKSRFFVLRYGTNITEFLRITGNIGVWHTDPGAQIWFYQDGLPESFSIFTASGKGSEWVMRIDYKMNFVRFYYAINKQNHWGQEILGSGETSLRGAYKTAHQFGALMQF